MFDPIRTLRTLPLLAILAFTLTACDSMGDEPVDCPAVLTFAIEVEMRNAETGAPEAENATGRVLDDTYVDTMRVAQRVEYQGEQVALSLAGAEERPGTYDVVIEKQGFETWTRTGIEPDVGECGVQTETLNAELTPVSTMNVSE